MERVRRRAARAVQSFIQLLVHVNPHLRAKLAGWYDDDAFRRLFCALLQPSEAVVRDTKELLSRHGRPMVGVHLRTTALNKGHVHSSWTAQRRLLDCTMATVARSTVARPPVFIAADTELARRRARTFFEQRGLEVIASEPAGQPLWSRPKLWLSHGGARGHALAGKLLRALCARALDLLEYRLRHRRPSPVHGRSLGRLELQQATQRRAVRALGEDSAWPRQQASWRRSQLKHHSSRKRLLPVEMQLKCAHGHPCAHVHRGPTASSQARQSIQVWIRA